MTSHPTTTTERRWQNPYHESAHYYANRHGAHGYEEWNLRREVWDIDTRHLELRVAYYDALRDAAFNKIRASQNQAKLDKLLECQRKYCS
jgi:hypothetical protein